MVDSSLAMAATSYCSSWADLNSELLVSIVTADGNGLSLRDYECLRGVCTAWRSALPPPYPCLLSLSDASLFSLPMRRSSDLWVAGYSTLNYRSWDWDIDIHSGYRVVGSGNGRFAVAINSRTRDLSNRLRWRTEMIFLHNPRTGEEIQLVPPGNHGYEFVRKIVFAPNPMVATVVALYDQKKVAYIDTSGSSDDMKWTVVDVVSGNTEHLIDLVFDDAGGGKAYCLDSRGGVRVIQIPGGGRNKHDEPGPVAVESSVTLLSSPGEAVCAPPYSIASTKHLFFRNGSLYQVWQKQNTSVTVRSDNGVTMSADEIFVLRYNPGRRPNCWDPVKDLGGCSVFVGKNSSAAVVRAGAVPGVRADCVYWIDRRGVAMVCDLATGASKPYILPYGICTGNCWYFNGGSMTSIEASTTTRGIKRRICTVEIVESKLDQHGVCGQGVGH